MTTKAAKASIAMSEKPAEFGEIAQRLRAVMPADILAEDGSNSAVLIEKLGFLLKRVEDREGGLMARRPVREGRFDYSSAHSFEFPELGLSFEDASDLALEGFEGCPNWHSPKTLFNLTPSPLLETVALSTVTSLLNPNSLWDLTSGKVILIERRIMAALAKRAGWDVSIAGGTFTSGGKATLTYAIKSGINRCDPLARTRGLEGRYVILASELSHFSLESVCNVLGIGANNCIRIPTTRDGTIDLELLSTAIVTYLKAGVKIACVMLNGGATINLCVDPVDKVKELLDASFGALNAGYIPHLHLDAVISWAWLFFDDEWPRHLPISETHPIALKIRSTAKAVKGVRYADSFGADFHKTGLCPYISSCYVTKDMNSLLALNNSKPAASVDDRAYGSMRSFDWTLENSRPCTGILTAYQVLNRLGAEGFRSYITYLMLVRETIVSMIENEFWSTFEVINNFSNGFEVVVSINFAKHGPISPPSTQESVSKAFADLIWDSEFASQADLPFVGYVPRFKGFGMKEGIPGFLLYPTSMHFSEKIIRSTLSKLSNAVEHFMIHRANGKIFENSNAVMNLPPR